MLAIALVLLAVTGTDPEGTRLASRSQPRDRAGCRPATMIAAIPDVSGGWRCVPADLQRRLGYAPALTRLPDGRAVLVEPDGDCSWIPDAPFGFDFHDACRMHDLGYDLIRVRWVDAAAQQRIDNALLDTMLVGTCRPQPWLRRLSCGALAVGIWFVASLSPTPNTPDPGSQVMPPTHTAHRHERNTS